MAPLGLRPRASAEGVAEVSWQQRDLLEHEHRIGRVPFNCVVVAEPPIDLTAEALAAYLASVTKREEALRTRIVERPDGRPGWITRPVTPEAAVVETASAEETVRTLRSLADTTFERGNAEAPLWSVTLVRSRRGPALVCGVFDHLIADAISLQHFGAGLQSLTWVRSPGEGAYRQWVEWQLGSFSTPEGPSAEFWRRHLYGTPANRRVRLPGAGEAPSGRIRSTRVPSTVGRTELRRACGRLKTTPFPLLLGATAAVLAGVNGEDDLTLNVIVAARPYRYRRVFGLLFNAVPVRVAGDGLADVERATSYARAAWPSILAHQYAPNKYIRALCGATTSREPGSVKVELNYQPFAQDESPLLRRAVDERDREGTSELDVVVKPLDDRGHVFTCNYDSALLDDGFAAELTRRVVREWERAVRTP
jgi:hypothetical protein